MTPTMLDSTGMQLRGEYADVLLPNPAEGVDWTYKLPSGSWWRWVLGVATFHAGEGIAIRKMGLQILDGDGLQRYAMSSEAGAEQFNTVLTGYSMTGPAERNSPAGAAALQPPAVWLPGGWQVGSFTKAIGAKDQFSKVRLWLAQAFDPAPGEAPGAVGHGREFDGVGWWNHAT